MANSTLSRVFRLLRGVARVPGDADAHLLERFITRREEEAFAKLVRRHGPTVLGVCRRVLRDEHLAEDAFQATFLILGRKAAAIGRPEALGSWLYRVACRVALRARKQAETGSTLPRSRTTWPGVPRGMSPCTIYFVFDLAGVTDPIQLPLELHRLAGGLFPDRPRARWAASGDSTGRPSLGRNRPFPRRIRVRGAHS